MARNEEKHYGRLNRLYLLKEKEEYEKAHPKRPRLDTMDTPEEIQKWLPSIKRDIDIFLKKTQVTCYSDAHVEECQEKINQLEKEFKAFIRKIKRLTPSPNDVIPWTSRPYKRKRLETGDEANSNKEFKPIATPILEVEGKTNPITVQDTGMNLTLMDKPLSFSSNLGRDEKNAPELYSEEGQTDSIFNLHDSCQNVNYLNYKNCKHIFSVEEKTKLDRINYNLSSSCVKNVESKKITNLVDYESSDSECS